jgi:hypothetical protein
MLPVWLQAAAGQAASHSYLTTCGLFLSRQAHNVSRGMTYEIAQELNPTSFIYSDPSKHNLTWRDHDLHFSTWRLLNHGR